jgi:hypothetical protein
LEKMGTMGSDRNPNEWSLTAIKGRGSHTQIFGKIGKFRIFFGGELRGNTGFFSSVHGT